MEKQLILIGGGDYRKDENKEIDSYILSQINPNSKFLIIPFAKKENEKRKSIFDSISKVFNKKEKYSFSILDENIQTKEEMIDKINSSDVLFLTGGDPILLKAKIKELNIQESIKNFKGLTIGYSAGAMIFSEKIIIPKEMDKNYPNSKISKGLGSIKFSIIPHYKEEFYEILKKLSKETEIYALENKSALILKNQEIKKIGKVLNLSH
jgi:dipeptidase E